MENTTKLSNLKQGDKCVIQKLDIQDTAKKKRMIELGFCSGLKVQILKTSKELMLVGVLGCSYSIDKDLASKIFVWKGSN